MEISVAQGNFAAAALDFACVIPGVGFIKAGVKAEKLGEAVVKALKVEKALNKVAKAVEATGEVLGKGKTLALKVVEKIPKIHVEEVYVGGLRTAEGVEVGGFRYFAVKVGEKEGGKIAEGAGKANKWVDEAGNINWPPNRGFISEPEKMTLKPGTRLDRYGNERGTFVAPEGTPYGMRALPKGTDLNQPYNVYEVVKPIDAMGGKASPWFDEPGLGTQYELSQKISDLLKDGYLKRVGA